jgi:hypothetical protein
MQQSVTEIELDKLATLCGSLRLHCNSDDDITQHLLEPIAQVLGAEAAAYRCLRLQQSRPQVEKLTSIGVPPTVADDYLSHFHRSDQGGLQPTALLIPVTASSVITTNFCIPMALCTTRVFLLVMRGSSAPGYSIFTARRQRQNFRRSSIAAHA